MSMSMFKIWPGQHLNDLSPLLHRPRPSAWDKFSVAPCKYLATLIYNWHASKPAFDTNSSITIACISDTHNTQPQVPFADILIHAGDLTQSGSFEELQAQLDWLNAQPHEHKITIPGNHDKILDPRCSSASDQAQRNALRWGSVTYLQNGPVTVQVKRRKVKLYGSPWTPRHGNWAFQYPRHEDIWRDTVPLDVDVLITHGPPKTHLDLGRLGCAFLLDELWRVKPRLHVCGHIHEGYGVEVLHWDELQQAYEDVAKAGGGLLRLVRVLLASLMSVVGGRGKRQTVLVNAAVTGGLRDEQCRKPWLVRM